MIYITYHKNLFICKARRTIKFPLYLIIELSAVALSTTEFVSQENAIYEVHNVDLQSSNAILLYIRPALTEPCVTIY